MHTEPQTRSSSFSRRASLLALGAAGLGAAVPPRAAKAKKKKGKANKRCKPQVAQCQAFFTLECGDVNAPECAALLNCCELLGTCNFDGLITCLQPLM